MRHATVTLLLVAGALAGLAAQSAPSWFAYDRARPFGITVTGTESRGAATVTDLTYDRLTTGRRGAYLVTPATPPKARRPGVLFVHWYEPPNPTSSRKEFLEDAVALAADGVTSLLIDTMWSDPAWFQSRDPENDLGHSIEQVKELRRALDLLASRPGVDGSHLIYVGHDFGAMYGALTAGVEAPRLKAFVFMAGTQSFSDWFLLWPKRDEPARRQVIARLALLDPTRHLPLARSAADPLPVRDAGPLRDEGRRRGDRRLGAAGRTTCGGTTRSTP